MMVVRHALILAGGLGTRLRAAVTDVPKPMAPVGGRPFLEHWLDHWIDQGILEFTLAVSHMADVIRAHFGEKYRGTRIYYVEEATPLGTGGGLLWALSQSRPCGPFLVMNGDSFLDVKLHELLVFHQAKGADLTFALRKAWNANRYGEIEVTPEGRVTAFLGKPLVEKESWINGGVYLVERADVLDGLRPPGTVCSLENELFPEMIQREKRFFGLKCYGAFLDIGVPEDFYRAEAFLKSVRKGPFA